MKKKFDKEAIQAINLFEEETGVEVKDFIQDEESAYFLVEKGKAGLAIGKNGKNIKKIGKMLGKRIKVFEYEGDEKKLIENMVMESNSVKIDGQTALVDVDSGDRGKVIGSNGSNIEKVRTLLRRNSNLEELRLK
ncbi:MAG: NusA-like transcription termination signal-binding factor [Candidatus Aenigmatarchaeota archaeon]